MRARLSRRLVPFEHELLVLREEQRSCGARDRLGRDDDTAHVGARRDLVHDLEQDLFDDRPEPPRAGLALRRACSCRLQGLLRELQLHFVQREELLVLLDDRVLGLGEDAHEIHLVERHERDDDRETADELGDKAIFQEIVGHDLLEDGAGLLGVVAERGAEAHGLLTDARLDDLLEALEGAADDEQDVRRVDLDEVLVGVLAAALRRHVRDRALEDLEQRLLDALTGHGACGGGVVALARDLVDLVDVDDAALCAVEIEVRSLDEPQQDVLDVLADITRFGEAGGVGDGERHVEDAGEGLCEEGLAATGRADEQHVRLAELDVVDAVAGRDALVVVVDGDREHLLRAVLADHILVEDLVDAPRARDLLTEGPRLRRLHELLIDDLAAEGDALIADVDALARDELAHLILTLPAERAAIGFATLGGGRHRLASRHRDAFLGFLWLLLLRRFGDGDERIPADEDLIDDPVRLRLLGTHEAVALRVTADLLDVLPGVMREDPRQLVDERLELLHLDEDVGRVATEAAGALVDHDARVRQRVTLALGTSRHEHRRHRRCLPDADRAHRRFEVLHRVVDRQAGGDDAAGRVDVEVDVALGVLRLEEQQLGDDQVGHRVLDGVPDEDDPLLEQAREDVVGALASP